MQFSGDYRRGTRKHVTIKRVEEGRQEENDEHVPGVRTADRARFFLWRAGWRLLIDIIFCRDCLAHITTSLVKLKGFFTDRETENVKLTKANFSIGNILSRRKFLDA